jgi:hypothetical protein
MRRLILGILVVLAVGVVALVGSPVIAETIDPHAYFNALVGRADHWKSYSLRDQAQLDLYKAARSLPPAVTYDYANDPDPRKQDAAKVVIPATLNSLPNQVLLPFMSEEGHSYLTTWDAWFGCEARKSASGLSNWKTFQWDHPRTVGGRPTIWMEVQTRFDLADSGSLAAGRMRQYSSTGGNDSIPPVNEFQIKCETWTRYWALMQLPPYGSGDVLLTLWAADVNRNAVKIYDRYPWKRDAPGMIEKFWLEFNTSTDYVVPTRGPITSYVRNVAILRDVADPTTLLQRPYSTTSPPPSESSPTSAAPAPPTNVRIVR